MIYLHHLNNEEFLINSDLIEYVEETPNTVISMASGRKMVVAEPYSEIKRLVTKYKQEIYCTGSLKQQ